LTAGDNRVLPKHKSQQRPLPRKRPPEADPLRGQNSKSSKEARISTATLFHFLEEVLLPPREAEKFTGPGRKRARGRDRFALSFPTAKPLRESEKKERLLALPQQPSPQGRSPTRQKDGQITTTTRMERFGSSTQIRASLLRSQKPVTQRPMAPSWRRRSDNPAGPLELRGHNPQQEPQQELPQKKTGQVPPSCPGLRGGTRQQQKLQQEGSPIWGHSLLHPPPLRADPLKTRDTCLGFEERGEDLLEAP